MCFLNVEAIFFSKKIDNNLNQFKIIIIAHMHRAMKIMNTAKRMDL